METKIIDPDLITVEEAKKRTSPKSDFWFKKIFGDNKEICIKLISAVTGLKINSIEYAPTESLGDLDGSKKVCFDVNVILDNGMRVNVEMQIASRPENNDRFSLYANRFHGQQLDAGNSYKKIKKSIVIHIFDYEFLDKNEYPDMVNEYKMLHTKKYTPLSDKLDVYVIELTKCPDEWHNELEEWCNWLKDRKSALKKGITMQNQYIAKAETIFNELANNPLLQMAYTSLLKEQYRELARLADAKEEGELKGKQEGKLEGKLETARKMLLKNKQIEEIMEFTDLSKNEILALTSQ